uniref:Uncharacterized protein n=1 Tax=Panagrolaimus sp. JU765 TaxID=591449 RepID=A0AC34QM98_9BILA
MLLTLILFWTAFGFAAGTPVPVKWELPPELTGFLKLNDGIVEIIGPGQFQIRPDPGYGFDVVGTNCTGGLKWCTDSQPTSDCNNFTATVLPDDLDAKINNLRVNADGKLRINKFHVKNVQNFTLNADKTIFLRVEAIFEGCPVFLAGVTVISLCLKNWFEKRKSKKLEKSVRIAENAAESKATSEQKADPKISVEKDIQKTDNDNKN